MRGTLGEREGGEDTHILEFLSMLHFRILVLRSRDWETAKLTS